MPRTYLVTMPITGTVSIEVEANNKQDAIQEALSLASTTHIENWEADEDKAEVEKIEL